MPSFDAIANEACRIAAAGLAVNLAKALRYEDGALHFVAAVGWSEEDRERIVFPADDSNPAGFAYQSRQPVTSNNLHAEGRFRTPDIFERYGINSTINIPVRSVPDYYGILEVDGQGAERFMETDVIFLEAVANVVSLSRERLEVLGDIPSDSYLAGVQSSMTDCVVVTNEDGQIQYLNECAVAELPGGQTGELLATPFEELFIAEQQPQVRDALACASAGQSTRTEAASRDSTGGARWWDISLTQFFHQGNPVPRVACSMRDTTARHEHEHEQELSELVALQAETIDSSSLLVREVHHRVRNSLQLVHNLLGMQATVSLEPEVKSQLQTAATRVRTIAAVHEKLYQVDDGKKINARHFLEGLVAELATLAPGRRVSVEVQGDLLVPSSRISALGMVVAELVTNSLKYGAGTVKIELARDMDLRQLRLTATFRLAG